MCNCYKQALCVLLKINLLHADVYGVCFSFQNSSHFSFGVGEREMSTNNQIYENLSSTHSSTSSKKHLNTGLNNNCINEKTNSLIMEQPVGTSSTSSSKKMSAATTNSVNSINNNSKPPLHVQEALPKGHKESLYATPLR